MGQEAPEGIQTARSSLIYRCNDVHSVNPVGLT
jgi:hypothetical protein